MNNEKKNNSNVLMVVGVIFILLAGGICVSKAWDYLPMIVKQGCLFLVAMFGLGGSYVLFHKDRLHKTENALFYIGNAFLGYFVLSVMNSVFCSESFRVWEKSCVILLVLLITVVIKLAVKKSVMEFVAGAVLLYWLVSSVHSLLEVERSVYACMLMSAGLLVCGLSYVMRNSFLEGKRSEKVIRNMLLVEEFVVYCQLLISVLLVSETESTGEKLCLGIALFEGMAMAVCILMQKKDETLQSVQFWIIMMLILLLVCYNNSLESELIVTIISSVTCVALIIWGEWQKQRAITLVAGLALAAILVYATRAIWMSIAWWVYMMVAGIIMVGIAVWREKRSETKEEKQEE